MIKIIYIRYVYTLDLNGILEHVCTTKTKFTHVSKDIVSFLIWFVNVRVK